MTEPLQITEVNADENGTTFTLSDGRVITDLTELQSLVGGTLLEDENGEPKGIVFASAPADALQELLDAGFAEVVPDEN